MVARTLAADSIDGSSRARALRLHNWDRLRAAGCLDIVASHLTGHHLFGGVGLPIFFMLSIALSVARSSAVDARDFARKRVTRVVIPWLFWSLVTAAEFTLRARLRGLSGFSWFQPRMLLYGPEVHFWFLPFSACASLGVHRLLRMGDLVSSLRAATAACLLLALCPRVEWGWPFEQWGFSLPAIALGLMLGIALRDEPVRPFTRVELVLGALGFLTAALSIAQHVPGSLRYCERHAGALVLVLLALWLPQRPDPITRWLTPHLLGVYILHLLVYRTLVEPALRSIDAGWLSPLRVYAAFVVTLSIVWLLRRTPLLRVL